jgi:parallel beta helix pectate lyase-like protein
VTRAAFMPSVRLLSGCSALSLLVAAHLPTPASGNPAEIFEPSACTIFVDGGEEVDGAILPVTHFPSIQAALDRARPGDIVCVTSKDHGYERPRITTSGTDDAPIQIRALGEVRTAGFVVEANHIALDGFTVSNQGRRDKTGRDWGIYLAGTGLQITNNVVLDTEGYGISCETYPPSCFDTVIAGNIVQGADGTGILAAGERILVENNDVSRSIMVDETDADGMRFFGSQITFRKNYIHDIFDRGYPADNNPHTDCFQTFDKDKPASRDIVIESNVCLDVDHQCLIVEALDKGNSSSFKFRNNICGNNGSQAVLLRGVADVEISNNLFLPSILYRGVLAQAGTTGLTIANNIFIGSYQAYDAEADSRQGLTVDYNLVYDSTRPKSPGWWAEPHGKWGMDPMFTSATGGPEPGNYRPAPGSPLIDAGNNAFNGSKEDLDSRPRVFDGDGNGAAVIDIGPYEFDSK